VDGGRLGRFVRNRLKPGLQYEEPEPDGLKTVRAGTLALGSEPLEILYLKHKRGVLIEDEDDFRSKRRECLSLYRALHTAGEALLSRPL
jgi:hypothetical protein